MYRPRNRVARAWVSLPGMFLTGTAGGLIVNLIDFPLGVIMCLGWLAIATSITWFCIYRIPGECYYPWEDK